MADACGASLTFSSTLFQRETRGAHRRFQNPGGRRRRKQQQQAAAAYARPRWSNRPTTNSNFYDYYMFERGPFAGMKRSRSRSRSMAFIDDQPRVSRAGRHRAKLYGNSVG